MPARAGVSCVAAGEGRDGVASTRMRTASTFFLIVVLGSCASSTTLLPRTTTLTSVSPAQVALSYCGSHQGTPEEYAAGAVKLGVISSAEQDAVLKVVSQLRATGNC